MADVWDSDGGEDHEQEGQADGQGGAVPLLKPVGPTSRASKRHRKGPLPAPRIKAVEVDMPGCSYNPVRQGVLRQEPWQPLPRAALFHTASR